MKIASFLFIIFWVVPSYGQLGQILPIDESAEDPTLVAFLAALKEAVATRDTAWVMKSVASETYIPFEGGETRTADGFIEFYFHENRYHYDIWEDFEMVFSIGGGGFDRKEEGRQKYYMPYTSTNLYEGEYFTELAAFVIALGSEVNVYETYKTDAEVLYVLNHEIIRLNPRRHFSGRWMAVILEDEREGYVRTSEVMYTIDVRSGLVKEDGAWKIKYIGALE